MSFHVPNKYRFRKVGHPLHSGDSDGNAGCFIIPFRSFELRVIASDGKSVKPQWEHVSVSLSKRCPNWEEMCFIKNLFWDEEDCIIQFHPPKSEYVNNHNFCLHLWRPVGKKIDLPPSIFVGIKP